MSQVGSFQPSNPPRQTLLARDLAPWTPDIDARRAEKPQIITGINFRDGVDGPISAFSAAFVNDNLFDVSTRAKVNELPIDNDILYGTPTGVYRIDQTSGVAWNILPISVSNLFWPWTIAKVGGFFYLAQYGIGLWQYDQANDIMKQITTPSGQNIFYLAESYGRLIYFDQTVVAVSALDDGTNFIPNLATAAQAQAQSMVGGTAYAIVSIVDGFLVYFSSGVMKATYTTAANVFNWSKLSEGIKLFSPNGSVYCPLFGSITLDRNGLWLTQEYNYTTYGKPAPWEVQMGNYIKKNVINGMDYTKPGVLGMYYSQAMQMIFVFFSANAAQGLFTTTFCYDCISQRWGSFNDPHYGIFETFDASTATYTCSYMDTNGYMKEFTNSNFSEDFPDDNTGLNDFIYRPSLTDRGMSEFLSSNPAVNGGVIFYEGHSEIKLSDNPPWYYNAYTVSGLYEVNSEAYSDTDTGLGDIPLDVSASPFIGGANINDDFSGGIYLFAVPYIINEQGLNSSITIGPFRANDQQSFAEETTHVESLLLGMQSTNAFLIYVDWNIQNGAQDWNNISGQIDWGAGAQIPTTYEVVLSDTNDGFSDPFFGLETLPVFADYGSSQLYKPAGNSSIYHTITISAMDVGDFYALKVVDLTAQFDGVATEV